MSLALRSIWLIFALLLLAPRGVAAQTGAEPAPFLSLSIAPVDHIFAELEAISAALGMPGGTKELRDQTVAALGIDPAKPAGLWISAPKEAPEQLAAVFFASVSDPKVFESTLSRIGYFPAAEQNGVKQYSAGFPGFLPPLHGKLIGSTFFLADQPVALDRLPHDPVAVLGDLPTKYLVAFRMQTKDVSPATVAVITQAMEKAEGATGGPAIDVVQQNIAKFKLAMTEIHEATYGLRVDAPTRSIRGEMDFSFTPGSVLAKRLAELKDSKSQVAGVLAMGNAAQIRQFGLLSPKEIQLARANSQNLSMQVDAVLSQIAPSATAESQAARRDFINGILGVLDETYAAGLIDASIAARAEGKELTVAAAMTVSDGKKLAQLLKNLAEAEKNNPDFPEFLFDYITHQNVSIHFAKIPTPAQSGLTKVFGEEIDLAVGTGEKTAWIAIGSGAIDQLKRAIDESAGAKPVENPLIVKLDLKPLLHHIGAIETLDGPMKKIGEAASSFNGEPSISFVTVFTAGGVKGELIIKEDVFKLVREMANAVFDSPTAGAGAGS